MQTKSLALVLLAVSYIGLLGCEPQQQQLPGGTYSTFPNPPAQPPQPPTTTEDAPAEPEAERPDPDPKQPEMNDGASVPEKNQRTLGPREPFEGWPKPELVLFVTGQQHGYIEPCGCTGLENQKGGLMRRHTLLNQLQEDRGWNVVALDVGNQVRRFGRQAEIKFQTTATGLKTMEYDAIGFGPDDLRLSVDEVFAAVASDDPENIHYLSANASLLGFTPKHRVIEKHGKRIGVTGFLGKSHLTKIANGEVELADPAEGLKESWEALSQENCDLNVLLAHGTLEESREMAKQFPEFDIVITAGGAGEPTLEPETVEGTDSIMVQVGTKGMYVGVLGIFPGEEKIRYERVALDARYEDSDEMFKLLASYQKQLESLGLEGLGVRPQAHPSSRKYVGGEACADCHTTAYEIWEGTPHAHALDTLVTPPERYQVSRHHDPECLACHVTGWNPDLYLPYESGYLSIDETPEMSHVSCENCHGPGSAHVDAENGVGDFGDDQIEELRQEMILPLDEARDTCLQCHDLDNSPDFHVEGAFDEYWSQVEHYGKD